MIVTDHHILRDGLRRLIESESDLRVLGEIDDGAATERVIRQVGPDVLLLDLATHGLPALSRLREKLDATIRIIALAAIADDDETAGALRLGAHGIVFKTSSAAVLLKSIRSVMDGKIWVGDGAVPDRTVVRTRPSLAPEPVTRFRLTPRELEVVGNIVNGFGNREIARRLSVTEDTVKHHLTNVFNKTGVSNRLELALFAMHHGILRDVRPAKTGPVSRSIRQR